MLLWLNKRLKKKQCLKRKPEIWMCKGFTFKTFLEMHVAMAMCQKNFACSSFIWCFLCRQNSLIQLSFSPSCKCKKHYYKFYALHLSYFCKFCSKFKPMFNCLYLLVGVIQYFKYNERENKINIAGNTNQSIFFSFFF